MRVHALIAASAFRLTPPHSGSGCAAVAAVAIPASRRSAARENPRAIARSIGVRMTRGLPRLPPLLQPARVAAKLDQLEERVGNRRILPADVGRAIHEPAVAEIDFEVVARLADFGRVEAV